MEFHVLTLFPEMFESPFRWGVLGKALAKGLIRLAVHNLRDYGCGPHRITDDYPYGGGPGMVMKPEPIFKAVESLRERGVSGPVILMSPQGEVLTQALARKLRELESVIIICGRYEGVDQRVRDALVDREISIGDYILTGGELPAMVLVETVGRLVGGVVGKEESVAKESFETRILDCPHYTRPPVFRGMAVPEVLLSGDHEAIRKWRRKEALRQTLMRRPELLYKAPLAEEDKKILRELGWTEMGKSD